MRPAVTFGDPERNTVAYLRSTALASAATIKAAPPDGPLGTGQHVQVELDGTPGDDYPVTERATVRLTCYAGKDYRTSVKALASLAQSYMYVWQGDDEVYGTSPLVGRSSVVRDPDTENLMIWFTFRLSMSPQPVP